MRYPNAQSTVPMLNFEINKLISYLKRLEDGEEICNRVRIQYGSGIEYGYCLVRPLVLPKVRRYEILGRFGLRPRN